MARSASWSAATGASGLVAVATNPSGTAVMASPWLIHTSTSAGQSTNSGERAGDRQRRPAVLAPAGARHLAAQLLGEQLGPVADAEDGDAGLVDGRVDGRAPASR